MNPLTALLEGATSIVGAPLKLANWALGDRHSRPTGSTYDSATDTYSLPEHGTVWRENPLQRNIGQQVDLLGENLSPLVSAVGPIVQFGGAVGNAIDKIYPDNVGHNLKGWQVADQLRGPTRDLLGSLGRGFFKMTNSVPQGARTGGRGVGLEPTPDTEAATPDHSVDAWGGRDAAVARHQQLTGQGDLTPEETEELNQLNQIVAPTQPAPTQPAPTRPAPPVVNPITPAPDATMAEAGPSTESIQNAEDFINKDINDFGSHGFWDDNRPITQSTKDRFADKFKNDPVFRKHVENTPGFRIENGKVYWDEMKWNPPSYYHPDGFYSPVTGNDPFSLAFWKRVAGIRGGGQGNHMDLDDFLNEYDRTAVEFMPKEPVAIEGGTTEAERAAYEMAEGGLLTEAPAPYHPFGTPEELQQRLELNQAADIMEASRPNPVIRTQPQGVATEGLEGILSPIEAEQKDAVLDAADQKLNEGDLGGAAKVLIDGGMPHIPATVEQIEALSGSSESPMGRRADTYTYAGPAPDPSSQPIYLPDAISAAYEGGVTPVTLPDGTIATADGLPDGPIVFDPTTLNNPYDQWSQPDIDQAGLRASMDPEPRQTTSPDPNYVPQVINDRDIDSVTEPQNSPETDDIIQDIIRNSTMGQGVSDQVRMDTTNPIVPVGPPAGPEGVSVGPPITADTRDIEKIVQGIEMELLNGADPNEVRAGIMQAIPDPETQQYLLGIIDEITGISFR